MQRRAAEESLTDHGKDNSNGRAHVGDAIRHKPGILGFLRQIGFMGATGACKTSGWPKPEGCRERLRLLPGSLRAEVRQGRGLPGQGPRRPADVLRLPRRALEACTHDQPHREHVRHGSSAHLPDQGLPVAQDGDGHGLQTPVRSEKMEKTRWIEPSRRDHSRRQIRRWRTPGSRRRMISPYTTFDNSSTIICRTSTRPN